MPIHTHYDNLKVARNAPDEVIRAAYKSLSQKYHPDRNPDAVDAAKIMAMLNAAYEVLSDPEKRRAHDEWIAAEEARESKNGARNQGGNFGDANPNSSNANKTSSGFSYSRDDSQQYQDRLNKHYEDGHYRYEQRLNRPLRKTARRISYLFVAIGAVIGGIAVWIVGDTVWTDLTERAVYSFYGAACGIFIGAALSYLQVRDQSEVDARNARWKKFEDSLLWKLLLFVGMAFVFYSNINKHITAQEPNPARQVGIQQQVETRKTTALLSDNSFTRECLSAVRQKSPNAPVWYSSNYCNCAEKEYSSGHSPEEFVATCSRQVRALLEQKTNECADKIGRREIDKPRIRECLDNS